MGFVKAAWTGSDKTPPHPAKAYKFSSTVRKMSDVSRVFWSHCLCFIWAGHPERFKTGPELKETLLLCPKTRGEFFCPCVPPVSCGARGPFPPLGIMRAGSTNPTSPLPISNPCGLGAPRGGCTVVKPQSVGGASGRRCYEVVGECSPQTISVQRAAVVDGPPSGGSGSRPKADRMLQGSCSGENSSAGRLLAWVPPSSQSEVRKDSCGATRLGRRRNPQLCKLQAALRAEAGSL